MDKTYFEDILSPRFHITDILETDNSIYVFFVSRKYHESHGNDNYLSVGNGPLLFNKKTQEHRILGSMEFVLHHAHLEVFETLRQEEVVPSLEQMIEKINLRMHVNMDEFEYIMMHLDINPMNIDMHSMDLIHLHISSEDTRAIGRLKAFFDRTSLPSVQIDANKIILTNNS